ncbi:MAG TPA: DUF1501 domain-containing protein, partial [Armatimonadota bacterium]|nr:DUF1501 domain-containing protein [Armatimonadota bacterium]
EGDLTMIEVTSGTYRCCDGLTRRALLQVGTLTAAGLALPDLLRMRAAGAAGSAAEPDTAVILLWLGGGPSHLDMYDMKPDAPAEIRGEFRPIATSVPGVRISEHLPRQAKIWDRLSVVRSVTHSGAAHETGAHWMMTGSPAAPGFAVAPSPSCGSIAAEQRGPNRAGLPAYVTVPNSPSGAGAAHLGAAYAPFATGGDPADPAFALNDFHPPVQIAAERLAQRRELASTLDCLRRDVDERAALGQADVHQQAAYEQIASAPARAAFDLGGEADLLRERYGRHTWGQSCLLARRLVEAGVTFATVNMGGWDTHGNNFEQLRRDLLPRYDQAFSALVEDLAQRGLDKKVLVLAAGEFGRTPRVNSVAGRDHWPGAGSVVFAGGGLKMGQAIGATDARGEYPTDRPYSPGEVLATVYHVLGIRTAVSSPAAGRANPAGGVPIPELV